LTCRASLKTGKAVSQRLDISGILWAVTKNGRWRKWPVAKRAIAVQTIDPLAF